MDPLARSSSSSSLGPPQDRTRDIVRPGNTLAKVVPALAPQGQARNLERTGPEERPPRMGPLASKAAQDCSSQQRLLQQHEGFDEPFTSSTSTLGLVSSLVPLEESFQEVIITDSASPKYV
ncbi:hypothetical protein Tco_0845343 [Tanacetum coccineum]